jgi:hypothetical protein
MQFLYRSLYPADEVERAGGDIPYLFQSFSNLRRNGRFVSMERNLVRLNSTTISISSIFDPAGVELLKNQ